MNVAFRFFVGEESRRGHTMGVDDLLLQYLLQHPEVDTATAAALSQRSEAKIREHLTTMEKLGYLEHGGTKRGAYWRIHPALNTDLQTRVMLRNTGVSIGKPEPRPEY